MSKRLYVGNLLHGLTQEELSDAFAQWGPVVSAVIVTDHETGISRGFGFVELPDENVAAAVQAMNGNRLRGRSLVVNEARPREAKPAGAPGSTPYRRREDTYRDDRPRSSDPVRERSDNRSFKTEGHSSDRQSGPQGNNLDGEIYHEVAPRDGSGRSGGRDWADAPKTHGPSEHRGKAKFERERRSEGAVVRKDRTQKARNVNRWQDWIEDPEADSDTEDEE